MTTYEIGMWFWLAVIAAGGASPFVAIGFRKLAELATTVPRSLAHAV